MDKKKKYNRCIKRRFDAAQYMREHPHATLTEVARLFHKSRAWATSVAKEYNLGRGSGRKKGTANVNINTDTLARAFRISKLCIYTNMTRKAVADEVGVTGQYVSRVMKAANAAGIVKTQEHFKVASRLKQYEDEQAKQQEQYQIK